MRLRKSLLVPLWAHADDKIFAHDTAAHVRVNHERKTTEHPPFLRWAFFRQDVADSLGYAFIDGHRLLVEVSGSFREADNRHPVKF